MHQHASMHAPVRLPARACPIPLKVCFWCQPSMPCYDPIINTRAPLPPARLLRHHQAGAQGRACYAMDPLSSVMPLYRRSDCSRITKLGRRVWRAEVLHQQGRCLLVEPWLPLHQRLVQELHSIPSQFGLLRPLQQPPITESTCTGDTDCRFQIQAWSWVIRHLPAAAPKHHTCLPHWDEVSGLATSMMSHHP